jgi:thiamine biosynthesis lipoprotein
VTGEEARDGTVRTDVVMGTLVTVHVVRPGTDGTVDAAIDRAFGWFREIEARCTRFSQQSELMQLTAHIGVAVPVSAILYEAVHFALMVAEESGGAFDPTVGHQMESRGFNREHRTRKIIRTAIPSDESVNYLDVRLGPDERTITLLRPLTLDLGAVAKGLAVDAAARELEPFKDFAIDAGGDLYLGGSNPQGEPWCVGIRHPRNADEVIDKLRVSNQAVCTSGDYERKALDGGSHILDPRTGGSPDTVASATVVASGAMLADALATAAFVLGPDGGIQLLDRLGVDGMILTPDLKRYETRGLCRVA